MFELILDLFFPKQNINFSSIHTFLTKSDIEEQQPFFKELDKNQKQVLETIFVAGNLKNIVLDDILHRAKFGLEYSIVDDLVSLIINKQQLNTEDLPNPDLLISVPPDPKRFLQRGFHLPLLLAKKISKKLGVKYLELVEKPYSTTQQTLLTREERLKNLDNKFTVVITLPENIANYTVVWLVDDITTTGSTLVEAAKVLKNEFPFLKIYGVVTAGN